MKQQDKPTKQHRENIGAARLEIEAEILEQGAGNWINERLDLELWKNQIGGYIAEILITCGDPDVRIIIDSRWAYGTLTHSWGWSEIREEPQTETQLSEEATAELASFLDEFAACS